MAFSPTRHDWEFFVSPYHPDSLRAPVDPTAAASHDVVRCSLTWNVFRTFEQIAPHIWMRPLVARFTGIPHGYRSAPHSVAVSCWRELAPPPPAMLRRHRREDVRADVVIETEDTVLTFVVPTRTELRTTVWADGSDHGLLELVESTSWLAGRRDAYTGIIMPLEPDDHVWRARIRGRAERLHRTLQARDPSLANVQDVGVITWLALADVLLDATQSPIIRDSERQLARCTAEWISAKTRACSETSLRELA